MRSYVSRGYDEVERCEANLVLVVKLAPAGDKRGVEELPRERLVDVH